MAGRLQDKVAIVTGAGTGIGEAIAHTFAREGARLLIAGLPGDPVADVCAAVAERGGEARIHVGNLAEEEDARACVQAAIDGFGRLDVLVNNAGVFLAVAETQDYPIDAFEETLRHNLRSVFLMTRFALPHLRQTRGCIVSAGSESGMIGLAQNAVYGATKGWIHAFTRGVAVEQAPYGVRANCVCPGPIDTAWTHKETGPMTEEMERTTVESTALGRLGTPEEVANVYAFLASDEASYVTGALWAVDGGVTVAKGSVGTKVPDELRAEPQPTLPLRHSRDGLANKNVRHAAE
ncbi:SDR family oxidoreductase [Azospirillum sp.]|uniref:SDR family NAD(P)-dependent oxidoreductase n=1 Tax=Azospirillum sp. TaxID=34012 RepID=UPI002D2C96C1|nr:SDR family oxidoreductase [Azospirillum sp.]HYD68060.1 SDR family oxidoreductase [Azospirillum sp.]